MKHCSTVFYFCSMHPLNLQNFQVAVTFLVKVTGLKGDSGGQVGHLARTRTEKTGLINQPFTSAKRQVAAEASVFHNAARVSMISSRV